MTRLHGAAPSRHAGRIGVGSLWLAAAVAALAPAPVAPTPDPPRSLQRVMEAVDRGRAIALAIAPDGDVWWVTAHRAVRFEAGDPTRARVAVDLRGGHGDLRGGADPISAAHVDDDGGLWLGTRHGSVWHHRDGSWRAVEGGFRTRGATITAIATFGEDVYVAGPGLWRGTRDEPLEAVAAFAGSRVTHAVGHFEHGVAVSAREHVWRGDAAGWRAVWDAGDAAVSALAMTSEGELWIATRDGLVRIDRRGRARRDLPGLPIASLAAGRSGSAWAGTRGSGLFARYARGWRPVDDASGRGVTHVTELASARGGALWLALADGGLLRAGPETPRPHVSAR